MMFLGGTADIIITITIIIVIVVIWVESSFFSRRNWRVAIVVIVEAFISRDDLIQLGVHHHAADPTTAVLAAWYVIVVVVADGVVCVASGVEISTIVMLFRRALI